MSFSSDVKTELMKVMPEKEHCRRAEAAGILFAGGRDKHPKELDPLLSALGAGFSRKELDPDADPEILRRPCCKKAWIRGVFLSCGSVTDPEKLYHLELVFITREEAKAFRDILELNNIPSKIIERKEKYVVYLKEGDLIAAFLTLTGAGLARLRLEDIRVVKEVRNSVNRQVNCETANLTKTIEASVHQAEIIERLRQTKRFDTLPRSLKELAGLRLEYQDSSLKELGELMDPPVSKSGVNHRMRKLLSIAEEENIV